MNGKLLVLLAAALSTVPCWAKIQVSGSRISFDEALTEQNISQAIADFQKKRGTFRRISLELKKCSDADLALAAEKFSNFQSIQLSIKDCPALTSLVWFITKSMHTWIPFSWQAWVRFSRSAMVPNSGCTLRKSFTA